MDDYLGFGSMRDYNGSTTLRPGANVVVSNNAAPSAAIISAAKTQKLGLVLIQNASILTNANFGTGNTSAPSTASLSDVALNGQYNVNDSLFTSNYANTTTMYSRGSAYTGNIPTGSKTLFKSLANGTEAFIGGWQNTGGVKTAFADRTMAFSTILKGGGITGKPIQALVIGQQMNNRSHYQKLLPMLATGIYAGAAGILDDFNAPVVSDDIERNGTKLTVTAEEPDSGLVESGVEKMAVYQWNGDEFIQIAQKADSASISFNASPKDQKYKVVATDFAGNEGVRYFILSKGEVYVSEETDDDSVASFDEHKVVLEATVGGSVTGAGTYKTGDVVQVSAKAAKDYDFLGWYDKNTDNPISFSTTYSFTIRSNMNIIAKFVSNPELGDIANVHAAVTASIEYSGKALTPKVVVPGLKVGLDYTVTHTNNTKVGVASVVIKGIGKYKGSKGLTYKIVPKKGSISSIAVGKKRMTIKWEEAVDDRGKHEIRYREKGRNNWVTKTVSGENGSLVIKDLKKGKQYEVQIRSHKKVSGDRWYGKWSKTMTSKKIK